MFFHVSASDPAPVLEGMDEDMGFSLPPVLVEEEPAVLVPRPQPRRRVCRNSQNLSSFIDQVYWVVTGVLMSQGNKRQAVEESSDLASSTSPHPTEKPSTGRSLALKACYGIQAWKHWTLSASDQAENTKVKDGSKPGNSPPLFGSLHSLHTSSCWK